MKEIKFRKELVWLMYESLTTNLELCATLHKDKKDYCESLMDELDEAYDAENIDKLDKLFGMCSKVLLENNII